MARILLFADDEGLLAETYRQPLFLDFHQLVAAKGFDSLPARMKQSHADLILLDLEAMTPGSCEGLCSDLNNTADAPAVPVIGITDDRAKALCLPSGAFVLQKPVPFQFLRDAVQHALQGVEAPPGTGHSRDNIDQGCTMKLAVEVGSGSSGWFQESAEPTCPFFKKAATDWLYPVTGYCRGRPDGKLMIPSIAEYRQLCTSNHFHACQNHQAKRRLL